MYKNTRSLLNDYYVVLYDQEDNPVFVEEDLNCLNKHLNIAKCHLLERIRNNQGIVFNGHIVNIHLFKKEKIQENYKRCK